MAFDLAIKIKWQHASTHPIEGFRVTVVEGGSGFVRTLTAGPADREVTVPLGELLTYDLAVVAFRGPKVSEPAVLNGFVVPELPIDAPTSIEVEVGGFVPPVDAPTDVEAVVA